MQYVAVVLTREVGFVNMLVNSYRCDEFVVNDTLSGVIDSVRQHILHSSTLYVGQSVVIICSAVTLNIRNVCFS